MLNKKTKGKEKSLEGAGWDDKLVRYLFKLLSKNSAISATVGKMHHEASGHLLLFYTLTTNVEVRITTMSKLLHGFRRNAERQGKTIAKSLGSRLGISSFLDVCL